MFTINAAGDVEYTYVVTNTGNTFLSDIQLSDDAGTPADTSDDLSTADFSCTPDLAGPVAPGASVTCTATLQVSADTTNVANTSGNPTDADGNDLPGLADPADADAVSYTHLTLPTIYSV